MSEAVTRNIRVSVEAEFAPERSNPHQNQWFFLYTVRLTNEGRETFSSSAATGSSPTPWAT